MPRADPNRSDYCASRHLLRNLENAAELRRNPLVRDYFDGRGASRRRDANADRAALDRIRNDVRVALARCGDHPERRTHVTLGRMHAALLRCDIDDQPIPAVAAELGLSERQLRRERRVAHEAFVAMFGTVDRTIPRPAMVCDVATVRLAEAVELQEIGQVAVARSAFASIATAAPSPLLRIEALCLAADAKLEAFEHPAAAALLENAREVAARHARALDESASRAAQEHIDFLAWLLRWQTGTSAGLATQPPLALAAASGVRDRSEAHRALFVRAAAAYAIQRWEVGDDERGRSTILRALDVIATLPPERVKERLAVMLADANLFALRLAPGACRDRFRAIEDLAAAHGHVRPALAARSERVFRDVMAGSSTSRRIFTRMLKPFGAAERRSMAWTFASAAQLVTQYESNPRDRATSMHLVESVVPACGMIALGTRCVRANVAIDAGRYDVALPLAESAYSDATATGNGRIRGAAARSLAAISLGNRRRGEARRYICEALDLTERFGSCESLARTHALAQRLDVA